MEPQTLYDNERKKARVSHAALRIPYNQEQRSLYEYPLPYCNSGNRYFFIVCNIVFWALSFHSHLPSWRERKKGLPNTEVSDSPNWLLQDAESPCRHDLISRLTWIT